MTSLAFKNGRWISASELTIPIYDIGFVLGVTVTERLRTFSGRIFRLEEHLKRLYRSLEIVEIDPGYSPGELADIAAEVVRRNLPLVETGSDLGMGIFVTPGPDPGLSGGVQDGPTVCVHTHPLRFELWVDKYRQGESVVVSQIVQVPRACWPPELKCRSRMHYFLADQRARTADGGGQAVLLDDRGNVCETSTANVVMFRMDEGLISPPRDRILPGISLETLAELAKQLGIPFVQREFHPDELATADELLLTSTSVCVLPVVRCNGRPVGNGVPGREYQRLLRAWSELVGVDIPQQAARFASRR